MAILTAALVMVSSWAGKQSMYVRNVPRHGSRAKGKNHPKLCFYVGWDIFKSKQKV